MTLTESPAIKADTIYDAIFERCLDFRIELDYDAARRFLRRIDRYNDFDGRQVLDALDEIDRLIPRQHYGPGNPNNGQRKYRVSVGREGSPVLYLDWYEWRDDDRLSEDTAHQICDAMLLIGHADEAGFLPETSASCSRKVTFRFWWD